MTYLDSERGVDTGRPVEGYKFIGAFATYRYTSADLDTSIAGETYFAEPVKRGPLRAATQDDEQVTLEIEMPFDLELVTAYAFTSSPPTLELEIYRVHYGLDFDTDAVLIWKGPVSSFSIDDGKAKVLSTSLFSNILGLPVPPRFYQRVCNHVLYDTRCAVVPTSFTATAEVVAIAEGGRLIDVDNDGFADAFLVAGEIVNNRNNERRLIMANVANALTVNFPFHDLLVGDEVTLRAGCDHSFATCGAKFSNQINFGGHPYIPEDNPFEGEL